jgi:6-phosphogluconate dehydrogenase
MNSEKYQLGMIGLGVMGRNMVLNMGDHGFSVAGYDKNEEMVNKLNLEAGTRHVMGINDIKNFIHLLETPRIIMLMVPAGGAVDAVIHVLLDYLDPGDLIIDGGNSHFSDTEKREKDLDERGIHYLGVGISGGEAGARHGPSIMPGGSQRAYKRVEPIFSAIAAQVQGEPCVTYLGPRGAGHYVKMVHNGIEYGLMELIAESYDLMKRGLRLDDTEIQKVFFGWNQLELNSYLIEITGNIFSEYNQAGGKPLVELILDEAEQNGTGMWTSQSALDLVTPVPGISAAVEMRNLSVLKEQRENANKILGDPIGEYAGDKDHFIDTLRMALYAGMILTFAQGFALLNTASDKFEYHFNLSEIAQIWRGGCIIRAALLNEISIAFEHQPELVNLMIDPDLGTDLIRLRESLEMVVRTAAQLGIPAPGFMSSLAYFDGYRSGWLPANLIQAQRDYFGAHQYERIDKQGKFHHQWAFD